MPRTSITTRVRAAVLATALAAAAPATALAVAGPASAHDVEEHEVTATITPKQLQTIHLATKALRTPEAALAAGYLPSDTCVEEPELGGGMGYHYVNLDNFMDGVNDPTKPDMLVYVPTTSGGLTLGAAEWGAIDGDQDLSTDDDRPSLFGSIPFNGPMPGHEEGQPIHYDLHVWLYKHNPDGMLTPWNPAVTC
jgi:hypothetical protein